MVLSQSTGDSMDENEKDLDLPRSNVHSEFIDADNPQTPEEVCFVGLLSMISHEAFSKISC